MEMNGAQLIVKLLERQGTKIIWGIPGGATNLITALADAHLDSVPIVAITGQVATALMGTDAFQEVDTYGLTLPVTKHNFLVKTAADLLTVIPEAFRIAESGHPEPVVVDVPKDVQTQNVSFGQWPEPGRITGPWSRWRK